MPGAGHTNLLGIAKVIKSNGTDGQLVLSFRDISPDDFKTKEPVFIYFDGLPVPFFVNEFIPRGKNRALVSLTDIENITDAEEIVGQIVYVDENCLDTYEDEEDFSFLIGWTVIDATENIPVGEITDFVDIPSNPCIEVDTKNGAALIPLHKDLITSLDEEQGSITLEIPSGLI